MISIIFKCVVLLTIISLLQLVVWVVLISLLMKLNSNSSQWLPPNIYAR